MMRRCPELAARESGATSTGRSIEAAKEYCRAKIQSLDLRGGRLFAHSSGLACPGSFRGGPPG